MRFQHQKVMYAQKIWTCGQKVLTCLTTKISGSLIWKGIVFYNKKLQNEMGNANKGKFGATFSLNR